MKSIRKKYHTFTIKAFGLNVVSNNAELIEDAAINIDGGIYYSNSRPIIQSFFGENWGLKAKNCEFFAFQSPFAAFGPVTTPET